MKLYINADDIGASLGVNRTILKAVKEGVLNKVSIMVNGNAFDDACHLIREYEIDHSLHLNLCEGSPVSPSVSLLINQKGIFSNGFISFWLKSLISKDFKDQIHTELLSQLRIYKKAFPDIKKLSVDSHQYYHMIPSVMKALIRIHNEEIPIYSVRVVKEPLLWLSNDKKKSIQNLMSANLLKWLILHFLTFRNQKMIKKAGINMNCYFCGVLYSGSMSKGIMDKFLNYLTKKEGQDSYSEILFHPGSADTTEHGIWDEQADLLKFYTSKDRDNELSELIK